MSRRDREQLAHWRNINARRSVDVLEIGSRVLKAGGLGDEEWSVREQLAFAALDMGALGLAESQIKTLRRKFPKSPRVSILEGMHLEVLGDLAGAKELYNILLKRDETHIAAHHRLIALLIPSGPSSTIPALLQYLDTFYTDADAWSLLAGQYAEAGLHAQALSAWGHVMVIQPWDSGAVAKSAGVAYTAGDYQLALKQYLRAIEMTTPAEGQIEASPSGTRLWWGVKQCTKRLLDPSNTADSSTTPSSVAPELQIQGAKLEALAELATEQILAGKGVGLEGQVTQRVLGGQSGPR